MTTGMTKRFTVHIHWISTLRYLHFNFFSASYCITFLSDGTAISISEFYLLRLAHWPESLCLYLFIPQLCYIFMFTNRLMHV